MKQMTKLGVALALVVGLAAVVTAADEMTLTGKVMCAKCTLKKADATKCQDVLVVTDAAGKTTEYYVEKTTATEKFGHVCKSEKAASVTGTVTEKDGKKWISPSKMEETKS